MRPFVVRAWAPGQAAAVVATSPLLQAEKDPFLKTSSAACDTSQHFMTSVRPLLRRPVLLVLALVGGGGGGDKGDVTETDDD